MKKIFFIFLLCIPSIGHALNITGVYGSDGGDKIPRQCFFPHCLNYSSSTYATGTWDGHTLTPFSAQNQTVGFQIVAYNNSGSDATNVTVAMSSLTCASGTGLVSTEVSSTNVMDTTTRPIQVFGAWYVQNNGLSYFPYGRNEYEERQYPTDMRVPCTVNVNNDCIPNGGTDLWTNRTMANMFLPVAWVPNEEYAPIGTSSYTVYASSSMSWYVDAYISAGIPAGQCTGTFSIFEGASLSTAVPVNIHVYGYVMPSKPTLPVVVDIGNSDTNKRVNGNGFPSLPLTGQFLTAPNNMSKLFKAHGLMVAGDVPDTAGADVPSLEYSSHTTGVLYTAANGYGNARGISQPDQIYIINMYGNQFPSANWSSSTVTNGSTGFCDNVNKWLQWCVASNEQCLMYTSWDEGTGTQLSGDINKWTTWLATAPACNYSGHTLAFMQTDDLPVIAASAPYVSAPTSAVGFDDAYPSSATWQVIASSIMAGNGPLGPLGQVWRYGPGSPIGEGGMYDYEEEGYVPESTFWAMWKKICYDGTCHGGRFFYEGNYWTNSDAGGGCGNGGLGGGTGSNLQDLFNNACTFGYYTGSNSIFGTTGFNYSQGDGVLAFPGTDTVYHNPSFGIPGGIATVVLKQIRNGINQVDYLNAAYAVNPSSTTALVQSMFPGAFWEVPCFNDYAGGDCSYAYGDRTWSYGANNWTRAAERALEIASSGPVTPTIAAPGEIVGKFTFIGTGKVQQ